jgi:hypothetical protein
MFERYTMKTYGGERMKIQTFLISAQIRMRNQLHTAAALSIVLIGQETKGGRTPTTSRQASRHETKDAVLLHS